MTVTWSRGLSCFRCGGCWREVVGCVAFLLMLAIGCRRCWPGLILFDKMGRTTCFGGPPNGKPGVGVLADRYVIETLH